ncbi:TetR/AcrR family transcriptional regulator [Embleya sp. NBC_00896]|uniref:TetR/AcrR family transcriptional regulator n=1 Tax=Embleya sp. NBC_00896 TaxID=2975961 RepID=UPI002F915075|nr:TetR/AcrR family transcriptional regulator [Embleya sp. NBC_00896]
MPKTAGRPRGFDREAALDRAVTEFWLHGYEATSVAGLTAAMGIKPPSLYAAFGDKRALFSEAIQRYGVTFGAVSGQVLAEEPDARVAVERLLYAIADAYTDPAHPPGCMVITAAVNCTSGAEDVKAELRAIREASTKAIRDKIATGVDAGRLPADTDVDALATYYAAIVQGMSTQACDGVGREGLEGIAALAMRAWPE